ncbi:hypothetical protein TgHK011_002128 [Trichoderma gracile]|nr:hypothetical protein TgHK011_002128 [Trichoderma gracile]
MFRWFRPTSSCKGVALVYGGDAGNAILEVNDARTTSGDVCLIGSEMGWPQPTAVRQCRRGVELNIVDPCMTGQGLSSCEEREGRARMA